MNRENWLLVRDQPVQLSRSNQPIFQSFGWVTIKKYTVSRSQPACIVQAGYFNVSARVQPEIGGYHRKVSDIIGFLVTGPWQGGNLT